MSEFVSNEGNQVTDDKASNVSAASERFIQFHSLESFAAKQYQYVIGTIVE